LTLSETGLTSGIGTLAIGCIAVTASGIGTIALTV